MKRIFISLVCLLGGVGIVVLVLNVFNPVWWQDTKLATVPYWGLATVNNNPLLPQSDHDLSATDYQSSNITPRVSPDRLLSGGPPKDGIPSIDNPQFEPIGQSAFADDELIIGIEINGDARAYPYAILNWHEIVNDTVGDVPVAVTYCPLCETNSVFIREIDGENVEFGVSGKLYESCLVMYDRRTDTLYSQPWGMGIVGSKTNHVLERVDAVRTTVGAWRDQHPNALILTTDTGYDRNYTDYPYGSYYTNEQIIFPVTNQTQRTEKAKAITQMVFDHDTNQPQNTFAGEYVAFTHNRLREQRTVNFVWQDHNAQAVWSDELQTIVFTDHRGEIIPNMALFNFVEYAHFR